MTHHVGYTLLFEQALQVVDPSVSIPYWEYTIECAYIHTYAGHIQGSESGEVVRAHAWACPWRLG